MEAGSHDEHAVAGVLASPWVRLGALTLLVVGGFLVFASVGGPDQASIERSVRDAGVAAPVVYVVIYVVLTVVLFPGAVITAAGGALFGSVQGTVLTVIGATIGATGAFLVGRWLGREQVERLAGKGVGRLDDWMQEHGFLAVLYTRLIPVVPFNVLNYAAGIAGLRVRDYVIATAVGIVPGTFAYAELGHSLTGCVAGERCDLTSPAFLTAVGLIVFFIAVGPFVNRWLRARGKGPPELEDDDGDTGSHEEISR